MTKPMGPIPTGFGADTDGMLLIAGRRADALAREVSDTPLFAYDPLLVEAKIAHFRFAFPGIHLHYALKANPYTPLFQHMLNKVDCFDLASLGELDKLRAAGGEAANTSFAGPGKRDLELAAAIREGVTINLESEGEAARALATGAEVGVTPKLAVRVNPPFEIKGSAMRMGGAAKPFGLDAERVPALVRHLTASGAEWRGLHIFAGSQSLSADALIEAQRGSVALVAELAEEAGAPPPLVNLGGGFGIPYVDGDVPLDIRPIGEALRTELDRRPPILAGTRFAIELGRWLVGEAGVYLTRILDRKVSQGRTFLIVDGGMHHQLAASGNFGQVIRRNYPVAIASRFGHPVEEAVTIVGCLCTPLDILADDVMMPRAQVGDLVAVFLAGAYGLTASPHAFLSHPPAREMLVNSNH